MPRDTRSRRLIPPATGGTSATTATGTAQRAIVSLLAQITQPSELLPHLHQHALDVTRGSCSLLFQHNPRNGVLQATSAFALDVLRTDPWMPGPQESALVASAFERHMPIFVSDADRQMPDLSGRLNARTALLLPLVSRAERIGLVAIGFDDAPSSTAVTSEIVEVADAFIAAIELFRLRQSDELQRDVRALLEEFSASLSATLNLSAGLDIFCYGANRLFGADRTSVWIHDRRARHLVLQASSDSEHVSRGMRVSAEDPTAPAAAAMRRVRAEILSSPGDPIEDLESVTAMITVPLRGCRRALGTIVLEGVRVETGGELDLLDRADELGHQLASAIENMQLLDDVMRSRRELENTFDSITHLVAVADMRGHIVHVNQAFASRVRHKREELLDRPIADHVGPELGAWLEQHAVERANAGGGAGAPRGGGGPVWGGPFTVTLTDLLHYDREPVGSVIVARDLTPQ